MSVLYTVSLVFSFLSRSTESCSIPMDGVGFSATLAISGIPVVIPPSIPPWWLVFGLYIAVFVSSRMRRCSRSLCQPCRSCKACAELDSFDCRDPEEIPARVRFPRPSVHGASDARWHVQRADFDGAADRVAVLHGEADLFFHLRFRVFGNHRHALFV